MIKKNYKNGKSIVKWIENNYNKIRGIKGYKSMSEERLLSALNESELVKECGKNFDDASIEKVKKDFNKL